MLIDRFGKDVIMFPTDEEHFTVNVDVYVSRQFLEWMFLLKIDIKITEPKDVVEKMKE